MIRPETDERDPRLFPFADYVTQILVLPVHQDWLNRPCRERSARLTASIESTQPKLGGAWDEWLERVVGSEPLAAAMFVVADVALMLEIGGVKPAQLVCGWVQGSLVACERVRVDLRRGRRHSPECQPKWRYRACPTRRPVIGGVCEISVLTSFGTPMPLVEVLGRRL
jgi:hypothetical protein